MWNQQPVRNLLLNPTLETAAGTNVIVRTNLALNPRGVSGGFFAGYGAQTLTAATGVPASPDGLTTAQRVAYTAGAANAGAIFLQVPDVNSQYTVSGWVYNEGATTESIAIALKGSSSSAPVSVPTATWTQISWTMTTPGTLGSGNDFGFRIGTAAATGSFLVTGVVIEKAVGFVGSFFDGASATAGDWNHAWTGTAHASSSVRRGVLPANIGISGTAAVIQSSEWRSNGAKSLRIIHTPSTTIAEAGLADISIVKPGITYTVIGKLRLDTVATTSHGRSRRFNFYSSSNGGANYTEFNGPQAPNAIGTHEVRYTFTVPADATNTLLRAGGHSWGTAGAYQADAWWDDLMLVEGTYEGEYVDGAKSFSKWDGSANASTSIGYPQWLNQIAGVPDTDQTTGTNSGPITVSDPYSARTIYFVYEIFNQSTNYTQYCAYGVANTSGINLQTNVANNNGMSPRLDFPGGDTNRNMGGLSTARTMQRHVAVFSFSPGLGTVRYMADGGPDFTTSTLVPGSGWSDGRLTVGSAFSHGQGLRGLVYYQEHDRDTRIAISRYLGNKYGAYVA